MLYFPIWKITIKLNRTACLEIILINNFFFTKTFTLDRKFCIFSITSSLIGSKNSIFCSISSYYITNNISNSLNNIKRSIYINSQMVSFSRKSFLISFFSDIKQGRHHVLFVNSSAAFIEGDKKPASDRAWKTKFTLWMNAVAMKIS